MLRLLLVTTRQAKIGSFVEGLSSDGDVRLDWVASKDAALDSVRGNPPHLVIVDSELSALEPLKLVAELLTVNAMVNTALMSSLSDQDFHETTEGFGILDRLPIVPDEGDARNLLHKLRRVLGIAA